MRGHARGRLGAASGPPPRGPWVPGRRRLRGLLQRLLSPLRCPPPTRPPPTRPPPSRLPATRVGAPLGGLSAGRALRGRSLRGSLPALRLGSSPSPPPPPRPPLRWKRSRPGLRPRRGRVCALRPPFGGSPCWRQSCWRVRLWLGPRRGPRPFAAPRRPCAPRKFALPACVPACGCRPRGPPCSVGPPLGGSALARRALAVGIVARAATAAGLLAALMLGRPPLRGESGRGYRRLFCAPSGRACGSVGPPARSRPLRSVGRLPPPSRGPPFPPRVARPSVARMRRWRSVPKGPSTARPSARWVGF